MSVGLLSRSAAVRLSSLVVSSLGLLSVGPVVQAQTATGPRVQFDAPYSVAVREIPLAPPVYEPREKLVESRIDISSMIVAGDERDVTQFVFQVQSLQRTMLVHDYLPRSARDTSIAGKVSINEGREDSSSVGLDLAGQYQNLTNAAAHFGQGLKENNSRKFERLPALETVVASGTVFRGTGVYFKLHTTDRQLLEGATTVNMMWRVPANWRGDYLHVRCLAEGRLRGQNAQRVGQRDFLVPLYVNGDADAQQTAFEFARSEANLRIVAREKLDEIVNRPQTPFGRGFQVLVGDNDQQIPHDWLERLLYVPSQPGIPSKLPGAVKTAASEYIAARQQLASYSGWQASSTEQAAKPTRPLAGR
ncbi:hypothetical protein NA78x_003183 [Anatilimnocola sp. NA78]|uniref:hypothetical protein n=1 Tax=Anatilimnocola sp. NA78 TaxID=3415683 RepID=UPI003CE50C8B